MNTTAINYKNVFELAESKGYQSLFVVNEETVLKEDFLLCELTLIQKWLRDTHKIEVRPYYVSEMSIGFHIKNIVDGNVIGRNERLVNSYEESLLNGINEALQLI